MLQITEESEREILKGFCRGCAVLTRHSNFDWYGIDSSSVVVRTQMAIAVFCNEAGDVVIRQEGAMGPDEDTFIVMAPGNAEAVANAILEAAGIKAPPE